MNTSMPRRTVIDRALSLPAWEFVDVTRAEVHSHLDRIGKHLRNAGFDGRDIFHIHLALDEAICNAIKHGHRKMPDKPVQVFYHIDRRRILAKVQDHGPGFDPNLVANPLDPKNLERPSGRGLLLMRTSMDQVCYNRRGNCVTLVKLRSSPRRKKEKSCALRVVSLSR